METKNLIKMANDIGNFFISYPDEEQAKKDTASHIQKFWGHEMRKQIKEYVSDTPEKNSQLNPFVLNAISKYLND
tara:strand:- start:124 stop:348 length:225 start_codon:yes stop_codon:yes gene_type:complete